MGRSVFSYPWVVSYPFYNRNWLKIVIDTTGLLRQLAMHLNFVRIRTHVHRSETHTLGPGTLSLPCGRVNPRSHVPLSSSIAADL